MIFIDGPKTAFKTLYHYLKNENFNYKFIIKGDLSSAAIAAASIVSKVKRDLLMQLYHNKYPNYNFNLNRGYPTKYHKEAILKHGIIDIHRKTFKPIKYSF